MLDAVAARVARGEKVRFRPTGSSMVPLIRSRQLVTVVPFDTAKLEVDDIVLVRVAGTIYLHRVTAIAGQRVQIGNNRGRINGWTTRDRVFGLCVDVDGVPRKNIEGKVVHTEPSQNLPTTRPTDAATRPSSLHVHHMGRELRGRSRAPEAGG